MAVPASGGTAREIAAHPSQQLGTGWPFLQWSADGRSIHYSLLKAGTAVQALMRVPASGGRPQELGTMPPRVLDVDGQGRYLLRLIDQPERMFSGVTPSPAIEIATVGGRPVARFVRRRGMWVWRFTADGRGAIAQHANVVAPIRVVPVAGGAVRQVSDERLYYWPLGWSADGSRVFAETDANGHRVILESPLDGSAAREWPIPAGARNIELSRDGRYLWFTSATSDPEVDQLFVQRLDGSEQRRVAPDYFNARTGVVGPGGSQASDELFFFKRRQGRLELWSARADGTSRLVHAFPLNLADRTRFAVHGARVAYVERRGDSTALLVVEGQNGRPSQLAIAAGTLQEPAWSNDGHGIAVQYYAAGDSARHAIAFVSVGSNGMAASPLRFVRTGRDYGYQVQWLPDDQAVTVFCGLGGAGTGVWLVSPRDGERPTELTRDEAAEFWSYRVSPDGRYVAYAAEIGRGSSIWRLDFGDVLARAAKD